MNKRAPVIFSVVFLFAFIEMHGYELADTAMQFSKGQARAVVYHSQFERSPVFQVSFNDEITVNVGGNLVKYFSRSR